MHKAILAAFGLLTVAGCGPLFPDKWPISFDTSSGPNAGQANAIAALAENDAEAKKAFAAYGEDAVRTCLGAFHVDLVSGDFDAGSAGKAQSYRNRLGIFMCDCARGTSAEACPEL